MSDIRAHDNATADRTVEFQEPGRRPDRSRRAGVAVVAAAIVVFVIGTIGPPLAGRGVFLTSDLVYLAYPWQAFEEPVALGVGDHGPTSDTIDAAYPERARFASDARDGEFTGWDPWIGGGHPLGVTSGAGVLNPLATPFLLAPGWFAPALVKLLGLGTAIGFMYLFCRRLGATPVPALVGGVAYAGSGYLVMWTNWPQADVAALLPALFWATERFLQRRTVAAAVPVALALAALLLGNFPAIVGYALFVLAGYVVVRLAAQHRTAFARTARIGAGVLAALLAGVLLVSATLLPFAARLGDTDTAHRVQDADDNLGLPNLLTTLAPGAYGLSSEGQLFQGPGRNQVESVAYLGVVTCALALCAAALPRARRVPAGATAALLAATAVYGAAIFAGGPTLRVLQTLPVFSDNYIGRALSVFGLTASALAALGLQAVLELRGRAWTRRDLTRAAVAVGLVAAVAGVVALRSVQWVRPFGGGDVLRSSLVLPALIGVATVGSLVLLWRLAPSRALRAAALTALPLLLVAQSLVFAVPLLPNESRATLYPDTPAQAFVTDHVGDDRIAAQGQIFYGDVPMLWGVRTFTGHAFFAPTWKDAILGVDAEAFAGNPSETFPFLSGTPEVATSPLLDRLGVTWFATQPDTPPFGDAEPVSLAGATCASGERAPVGEGPTAQVPAGDAGVRGVTVRVCGAGADVPYGSRLVVRARAGDAEVRGAVHLRDAVPTGDVTVAVPAEALAGMGDLEIGVSLQGAPGVDLPLATTPEGHLALDVVRPADDDLRLTYADDLRIYERTAALPRIRWASRTEVVADHDARLDRLASGRVPADTVVLSSGENSAVSPPDAQDEADITIVEDGPDAIVLRIDAAAAGHVVIADALQTDWSASVDGAAADLVPADHAGVAVEVPAGTHEVRLELAPRGQPLGVVLGIVTAAGLAVAVVVTRRRSRHAPRSTGDPGDDGRRPAGSRIDDAASDVAAPLPD